MSTNLTGDTMIIGQDLYTSSATQQHVLGQKAVTPDGRTFRYVLAGATALVPGKVQQAPAETTAAQDETITNVAVGDTTVTTTTTTTVTANQFAGGYLVITAGTLGIGQSYKIKSHPAASGAVVTYTLEDPIRVATTGTARLDVYPNPYSGVIVCPTTLTSAPVGVAVHPVAAAQYGWIQVGGPCPILADGANAVGAAVVASNAVAGAVEDAASSGAQGPTIGTCLTSVADAEYGLVNLLLS